MDPLTLIAAVTVGGVLIGGGVHFVPVGGAPAAMATATGSMSLPYIFSMGTQSGSLMRKFPVPHPGSQTESPVRSPS